MGIAVANRAGAGAGGLARRYYFTGAFTLLLILSLVAFSDNLITDVGQPSNSDPKVLVHGFFASAWVVALLVQANFARTGNMRLHRRLGTAAFVAALGLTLTTIYVFVAVWKGWDAMDPEAKANRILLPSFSIMVVAGYLNRRKPERHKRLIYAGTLFLLEPILARCFDPAVLPLLPRMPESQVGTAFAIFMIASWSAFFLSLFAYDWAVSRRIHPISGLSFAWAAAVNGYAYLA